MKQATTNQDWLNDFKVENYDVCESWGAHEWLLALSQRSVLRHYFRALNGKVKDIPLSKEILSNEREFFLKVAQERMLNPMQNTAGTPYTVVPCALRDFYLSDCLRIEDIVMKSGVMKSGLQGYRWSTLRDIVKAMGEPSFTFLGIDLEYPDSILQEKFTNWLTKVRAETGIEVKHSDAISIKDHIFLKWHSQKLLPYLDVIFCARLSSFDLTQDQIGQMLFPSLDDTKDRLKSIPKNALRLLSRETMMVLARQNQRY